MQSHRSLRSLSILLMFALLLVPWSLQARPLEAARNEPVAAGNAVDLIIDWLAALWGNAGCTWDPNGGACRNHSGTVASDGTASLDAGCTWDPSGGCRDNG